HWAGAIAARCRSAARPNRPDERQRSHLPTAWRRALAREAYPADHLLRSIDRFVDLEEVRRDLSPFYSSIGRPSIDPELMIRMLLIGYCFGLRSERRLCDEVHLNSAGSL